MLHKLQNGNYKEPTLRGKIKIKSWWDSSKLASQNILALCQNPVFIT